MRIRPLEFLRRRSPATAAVAGDHSSEADAPARDALRAPPAREPAGAEAPAAAGRPPVPDARRLIVERFEAWLDGLLAEEPAPAGVAEEILAAFGDGDPGRVLAGHAGVAGERLPDRTEFQSALTRLAREVGLQGRAFKALDQALVPLRGSEKRLRALEDVQGASTRALEALADEVSALREAAQQEAERASLEVLLDLYGRLRRGLEACRRQLDRLPQPGRRSGLRRLLAGGDGAPDCRAAVEALAEGYSLTLGRLLEALRRMEITALDPLGAPFEPHTMTAVSVAPCEGGAAGTVTEVCEPGFLRRGEVLRPAMVEVAAAPHTAESQRGIAADTEASP